MKIINIKQPANDNMGASFEVLTSFLQQINQTETETELTIDLSNIKFAFPFFLLPLTAVINQKIKSGVKINLNLNSNPDLNRYLNIINFPAGINHINTPDWQTVLKSFSRKTYLPVCAIPARGVTSYEREQLLTAFNNTLYNQLGLSGRNISPLSHIMSEAIDNIVDHAKIDNGFLMVQNYSTKGFLDVCIADTGIGILQTYKNYGYNHIKTDSEAIDNALHGKSTKDMKERGFGISTSRKMLVEGLGGNYFIFSGSAFYIWTKQQETILNVKSSFAWKGTMLALRIPKNIPKDFKLDKYLE